MHPVSLSRHMHAKAIIILSLDNSNNEPKTAWHYENGKISARGVEYDILDEHPHKLGTIWHNEKLMMVIMLNAHGHSNGLKYHLG